MEADQLSRSAWLTGGASSAGVDAGGEQIVALRSRPADGTYWIYGKSTFLISKSTGMRMMAAGVLYVSLALAGVPPSRLNL